MYGTQSSILESNTKLHTCSQLSWKWFTNEVLLVLYRLVDDFLLCKRPLFVSYLLQYWNKLISDSQPSKMKLIHEKVSVHIHIMPWLKMYSHNPSLECVGLQLGPPTTDHNWGHQGWFRASNTNGRSRCGKPGARASPQLLAGHYLGGTWCPSAPSSRGLRHSLIQRSPPLSEQISGVSRLPDSSHWCKRLELHLQYGWLRMVRWAFLIQETGTFGMFWVTFLHTILNLVFFGCSRSMSSD